MVPNNIFFVVPALVIGGFGVYELYKSTSEIVHDIRHKTAESNSTVIYSQVNISTTITCPNTSISQDNSTSQLKEEILTKQGPTYHKVKKHKTHKLKIENPSLVVDKRQYQGIFPQRNISLTKPKIWVPPNHLRVKREMAVSDKFKDIQLKSQEEIEELKIRFIDGPELFLADKDGRKLVVSSEDQVMINKGFFDLKAWGDPDHLEYARSKYPVFTSSTQRGKQVPPYRGRSKSRDKSSKIPSAKSECRYYSKTGYCRDGISCKFAHDYNRPITNQELRFIFDSISATQTQIQKDQMELSNNLEELKRTTDETVGELTDQLRKLSFTPRDINLAKKSHSNKSLKDRSLEYAKKIPQRLHYQP